MIINKKSISLVLALIMVSASVTTVFAQSETDPLADPPAAEETSGFLNHPIVLLLSSFFESLWAQPIVEAPEINSEFPPEEALEPVLTDDPVEVFTETTPEPLAVVSPQEEVAALHVEEDLGFGVMTKLFQMAADAKAACASDGIKCDVTIDSLVAEFKTGTGIGLLNAEYGKPDNTGVGQVRKEIQVQVKSNNGKAKGKNKN